MKDHHVHDHGTTAASSCTTDAASAPKNVHRHAHSSGCCDGHHHHRRRTSGERSSVLGSIIPILACALCPTCISVWAQVLSVVGVGVVVTETQHHVLLGIAIVTALLMGAFRYVRTRIVGPLVLTFVGCVGLGASHFAEENHVLSWLSIALILGATLWQRRAERSASSVEPTETVVPHVSRDVV